jgi:hypothetical protein
MTSPADPFFVLLLGQYMLKATGKVDQRALLQLEKQFNAIDSSGDGIISAEGTCTPMTANA